MYSRALFSHSFEGLPIYRYKNAVKYYDSTYLYCSINGCKISAQNTIQHILISNVSLLFNKQVKGISIIRVFRIIDKVVAL